MKSITSILSICALTMLMSCGGTKSNDTATATDSTSASTDSINIKTDIKEGAAASSDVRVADTVFRTADLTLFELVGHVKTCKQGEAVLKFDQDGKLKSYTIAGQNQLAKTKREKGRIVQYISKEDEEVGWADEHQVDWNDDNSVKQFVEVNMEGAVEYTYTYGTVEGDASALPRILSSLRVGEGYNWSGTTKYTYLKFDEQHNWTERKALDELFCDYDGHQENSETTTEKRVITYY